MPTRKVDRNRKIYERRLSGVTIPALAKEFAISEQRIGSIIKDEDFRYSFKENYQQREEKTAKLKAELKRLNEEKKKHLKASLALVPAQKKLEREKAIHLKAARDLAPAILKAETELAMLRKAKPWEPVK